MSVSELRNEKLILGVWCDGKKTITMFFKHQKLLLPLRGRRAAAAAAAAAPAVNLELKRAAGLWMSTPWHPRPASAEL